MSQSDGQFSLLTVVTISFLSYTTDIALIGLIIWIVSLYVIDKTQKHSTLRYNHPVLARLRYFFEHLGTFFRQYFFSNDREEMPFNRAERSWIYRAAKNVDNTVPFGSSLDMREPGTIYFVNDPFPILETDAEETAHVTIGPYCKYPYSTSSIFNISGMSFGAISAPAIKSLSKGAQLADIWMNTGEGGLSSYHLEGGGDIVFQIGTAKFGVRTKEGDYDEKKLKDIASHEQVKMFEIKLSQGAKPGKGGILPAAKITKEIAETRGIEMGKDALSPNRHSDINNIDDLLDKIAYVRKVTGKPVGFKVAVGSYDFFESLCKKINKRGIESAADFITIDSSDGGTGAAPMSLADSMGLPIQECLPPIIDIIKKHKLKDRIKICASGKLSNPSEVAWALCVGADFVNSARGFMMSLGCIQSLQCNKNTCPTGIATHDKKLHHGLDPTYKSTRVMNYVKNMEKEIASIAHACGVKEPRQLTRKHARIVVSFTHSESMEDLYSAYSSKKKPS
jgi:glutamate synthase domain-containing protein 2